MQKNIINKILENKFLLLFFGGATPLVFALISQYVFGLYPCELCIFQRIPFAIIILLSFGIFFAKKNQKLTLFIMLLCCLSYFINAGIAFYHVGVESHWWKFGDCSGNFDLSNFENFKNSVMNAPNVRCDDVQFRFLGISMAGWNIFYCLFFAIYITYNSLLKKT